MNLFLSLFIAGYVVSGTVFCAETPAKPADLPPFSSVEQAKRHPIVSTKPADTFFEGAVLGNGGLGVIISSRPDAVVLYFGHNDVWDIRVSERNKDKIGTFKELFAKVDAVLDTVARLEDVEWYRDYLAMARENYAKPYPRPFPCGSIILWFDRRDADLMGHTLHIDTGVCTVDFLIGGEIARLEVFADMTADRLWARMVDRNGNPVPSPFLYATLIPDPATPQEMPRYTSALDEARGALTFRQVLPYEEITKDNPYTKPHPKDKAFTLSACCNGGFDAQGALAIKKTRVGGDLGIIPGYGGDYGPLQGVLNRSREFVMCVQLDHGPASSVQVETAHTPSVTPDTFAAASQESRAVWREYWEKSGVALDDPFLEKIWYWNLYFLRCSLRPGVTCPGLFANWSHRNIGTAWHGDYHMNYNTQQPFWGTFSCNHPDLHLPYVDMVEKYLLPISRQWAREYYDLRGAFFPHSAYPVDMTMIPYPLPHWGWEVFETPWTVQSLWWHYTYTMDEAFLRDRAFGVIKEAVLFLVDYMKRPDAHGERFGDDRYHIFPSVPPELYGLQPGFKNNYDTIADLTLTRFVFNAFLEACRVLKCEKAEKEVVRDIRDILAKFPDYPTAESSRGQVFVSVPGEQPEIVYNVPASLMSVFPGEHHGLHSARDEYTLAVNTYHSQQNEGGNDLVFLNVQAARLGILDLDKFRRQVEYCLLPNGTCADMVLQIHGRYTNNTPFDFMAPMGIWFENFSLPFVINECLFQSYNGELRFFPNWQKEKTAEFRTLRACGAFLVSARLEVGEVRWVDILSEAGKPLTVISPWKEGARVTTSAGEKVLTGERLSIPTKSGERIRLRPNR